MPARAISYRATTRFTFDDGTAVNVVEFTFAEGDTDGDGDADLADFGWLQNCANTGTEAPLTLRVKGRRRHEGTEETSKSRNVEKSKQGTTGTKQTRQADGGQSPPYEGPCLALDANEDATIDLIDYYEFTSDMHGP